MSGRITEHSKRSLYKMSEATLFRSFGLGRERIDYKDWPFAAKGLIYQNSAIACCAGPLTQFVCNTLCRFKNPMKVIID